MGRREQHLQELVEQEVLRRMRGKLPASLTPKLRRELAGVLVDVLQGTIDEAVQVRVLCLVTGDGGGVRIRAAVETTPVVRRREPATVLPIRRAAKAGA